MDLMELSREDYRYNLLKDYVKTYLPEELIRIISVKRVNNKYFSLKFLIRQQEMDLMMEKENRLASNISLTNSNNVGIYMHATDRDNVESILRENLNWRKAKNGYYGVGVSFTQYPRYARQYCKGDVGPPYRCAFIVCEVLEGNVETVRCNSHTHPPHNVHAYRSHDKKVLVKFDDYTFNPKFIVLYDDYAYPRLPDWSQDNASDMLDSLRIAEEDDFETRQLREFLKEILQIPYENKYESSLAFGANRSITRAESSVQPSEAEILLGNSERTQAVEYDRSESNEQALHAESHQTDILSDILSAVPSTWRPMSKSSYEDGYCTIELCSSSQEYRLVAQEFEPPYVIKCIKRVQNPFQLALFKISREEARAEGCQLYEGYHAIYEDDLDTALKYTLDFRRYEHGQRLSTEQDHVKQPKFYTTIAGAINAFHGNQTPDQNKLILICDVLSERLEQIQPRNQADYHINYAVLFE